MVEKTKFLVDGHVHIYPHYNLLEVLQVGTKNLENAAQETLGCRDKGTNDNVSEIMTMWLLTERADCNFFQEAMKSPPNVGPFGFTFIPGDEKETIVVQRAEKPVLYILAGRQIVAKEGLEILSLASTAVFKDREHPIDDVIKGVIDSGGVPALNWAPGKWFFSRGKVVRRIVEEYSPENLVLGDTTLRNALWRTPKLMAAAQERGFKVTAGSDPLPFNGEEKYIGSYGFCLDGNFNADRPADAIRSLLKEPETNISLIGKRNGFFTFCRRQYKIMAQKRGGTSIVSTSKPHHNQKTRDEQGGTKRDLNRLSNVEYDVIIVGAGIYGVNAAWDAALRGLKVALIDKSDFAHATSFNMLKIIHGGLRYLQQLDFKRMRESIHERTVLMRIAPHLVFPQPFVMPTYGYKLKSRSALFAALLANDLIGFNRNVLDDPHKFLPRGHIISKEEVREHIPGYVDSKMSGGALWYDCRCRNTERLALSFVLSAADAGADVANYVACIGFLGNEDKVTGIKAKDSLTGSTFDIRGKIVLNTAGPWVDNILQYLKGKNLKKRFMHSSGMNIVVNRKLLNKHGAGLQAPYRYTREDGSIYEGRRILFFLPWKDHTIVGTNHLPYHGDPNSYRVKEGEVQDFLNAVNRAYPQADISRDEISFVHGGLLPTAGVSSDTGEVQLLKQYGIYDHLADDNIDGLITVMGVKYTTHRDVASKAIDLVLKKLHKNVPECLTEKTPVYGGHIKRFEEYVSDEIKNSRLNEEVTRHLVYNYGSQYKDILKYSDEDPSLMETVDGSDEVLRAEIVNAVRQEMVFKLSDSILRRTDLGSAGNPGEQALRAVSQIMAKELGWDEATIQREIEETKALYHPSK